MKNLKITTPLVIIALIVLICVGVFLVYVLVADRSDESTTTNSTANTTSLAEKECLAKGGEWGNIGLNLSKECNLPSPDAGKECTSSSDCSLGSCFAENQQSTTGTCSKWQKTAGCHSLMENGKVLPMLCVD